MENRTFNLQKITKEGDVMNSLQIFKNDKFGEMRTTEINNIPYICLTDVCKILDIKNVSDCKDRLNLDGVVTNEVGVQTGYRKDGTPAIQKVRATFINESNLYKVIFQSRKPEAEQFTEWVTSDVLPSIRKTGGYIIGEENMNEDELILKAMEVMNNKVERLKLENLQQKQIIGELTPKADYTDKILQSKDTVTVSSISKDYGMGAISFNKILHNLRIQYKQSGQWLLYDKYQKCGYTQSKTTKYRKRDGSIGSNMNTEWTQKGRLFLYNKLKENGIVPLIEREVSVGA